MKRHRLKFVCLAVAAITLGWTARSSAFLGFVVFDPSNYAQAIEQVIRLEQQTAQLIRSYIVLRSQYEQMLINARRVPVDMSLRYRAALTPWRPSTATSTYGTTAAWTTAVNSGLGVAGAWAQATEPLHVYGPALASVPADQLGRLKTSYGTVELADGVAQHALETIGRLRANAGAVQSAIQALENDSLSSAPEMNTEVAVLNKLNAAGLIAVRTAQDTNKLLVAMAERQTLDAKRTRDAEARAFTDEPDRDSQGQDPPGEDGEGREAGRWLEIDREVPQRPDDARCEAGPAERHRLAQTRLEEPSPADLLADDEDEDDELDRADRAEPEAGTAGHDVDRASHRGHEERRPERDNVPPDRLPPGDDPSPQRRPGSLGPGDDDGRDSRPEEGQEAKQDGDRQEEGERPAEGKGDHDVGRDRPPGDGSLDRIHGVLLSVRFRTVSDATRSNRSKSRPR
jgi:hypothetical protein